MSSPFGKEDHEIVKRAFELSIIDRNMIQTLDGPCSEYDYWINEARLEALGLRDAT